MSGYARAVAFVESIANRSTIRVIANTSDSFQSPHDTKLCHERRYNTPSSVYYNRWALPSSALQLSQGCKRTGSPRKVAR